MGPVKDLQQIGVDLPIRKVAEPAALLFGWVRGSPKPPFRGLQGLSNYGLHFGLPLIEISSVGVILCMLTSRYNEREVVQ